ncbi:MAG: hypothetical protein VKI82_06160 [Leptolyngbya sp.]|nr:hypothetical protein [Leptolyngbya sp.]
MLSIDWPMQYLAKVQNNAFLGRAELALLAARTAENIWERLPLGQRLEATSGLAFQEGHLVLVELDDGDQVSTVEDATPWVLDLVDHYLSYGLTPAALQQEIERAEQWRQSLTLQTQEVERRALETAARRDEIQELERNLKQERAELEKRWEALNHHPIDGGYGSPESG